MCKTCVLEVNETVRDGCTQSYASEVEDNDAWGERYGGVECREVSVDDEEVVDASLHWHDPFVGGRKRSDRVRRRAL